MMFAVEVEVRGKRLLKPSELPRVFAPYWTFEDAEKARDAALAKGWWADILPLEMVTELDALEPVTT